MDQAALTGWALANGWRVMDGHLSLAKPSNRKEAIVRLVLKATVVSLEVKKPAGKWERMGGGPYGGIEADEDGMPRGLGFERVPSLGSLMRDNKDAQVFSGFGPGG